MISSQEFKDGIDRKDELCVLAQALSNEDDAFHAKDLITTKDYISQRYIDKAQKIINMLVKNNLHIFHKDKIK